jgi:hypothetical protein
MKIRNRLLPVLLAAALCVPAAGCSVDKSWAIKDSSTTIPIGVYIYNLYSAYEQADSEKADSTKSVLEQKIDNKESKAWIRERALTNTKMTILLDKKIKDMKLTYSEDYQKEASQMNSEIWTNYSSTFEGYGISKSSFELSYGTAAEKMRLIFNAIYGKNGTNPVSDDDLKAYYAKTYTNFSYMVLPLYTTDSDGNYSAAMTDDQKKTAKKVFDEYAEKIKAGTITMEQAGEAYKKAKNSSDELLHDATVNIETDTSFPAELKTAIKAMKAGDVKAVELSQEQAYVLVYKKDSNKAAEAQISKDGGRESLLTDYKWGDFTTQLEKEADALTGITVNDKALNSYDPKMFE